MIRCAITDGRGIAESALRRVDWIQVREKSLSARRLALLVQSLTGKGPKIVVNTRADVALAAAAHGVHLPSGSIPPSRLRPLTGPGFLIGVSCHSLVDAVRAQDEGADYLYLSPIFAVASKPGYGPPLGLDYLRLVCERVRIPVLALGGVDEARAPDCVAAGAAGFASISAFAR